MVRTIPFDVFITWPTPNYTNPVTFGDAAFIVNIVFMALSVPTVSLRMFTRWYMRRWLGWDDFWCGVALLFALGFSIATILAEYKFGSNAHIWDIRIPDLEAVLKTAMATKVLFTCAGTAIRQSLLCFYLRLIGEAGMKRFRWAIHGVTVVNISVGIAFTILCIFQCTPVRAYWMYPSEVYGYCLDEGAITLSCGIIITICDVATVLLPIPIILRLQMSWRQKLGVSVLLNLGLGASAAAAVRSFFIWKALVSSYDETWWAYPLWLAASIELHVSIMAACAPAIRPFVVKYMPWVITPFHLIGDLVSHVYYGRKSLKELSAASSTVVSERDQQQRGVNVPPYDSANITPSRSMEKAPYNLSELEMGASDGDSGHRHFDHQHTVDSDVSLNKEEVLFAVSQAIRGVRPLPDKLFEQHDKHSTCARSSQDRQRPRSPAGEGHDTVISQRHLQGPSTMYDWRASRHASGSSEEAPLKNFEEQSFELANTPLPSFNATAPLDDSQSEGSDVSDARASWTRATDTRAQIPGGNAYGFTGYPNNMSHVTGSSRQPRAASAEGQRKEMPNAFWNRERAKDRKKGRRRSKSLEDSSRRSSDDGQRTQGESNRASAISGVSNMMDPLTASLLRQYSVNGRKKTVDVPASKSVSGSKLVERWPQATMRRNSSQKPTTSQAEIINEAPMQRQSIHQASLNTFSADSQRFSPFSMAAAPSPYPSIIQGSKAQQVIDRNRTSREPPRVVRGTPGLSERGMQRLMQQQQDSDSTWGSLEEEQAQVQKRESSSAGLTSGVDVPTNSVPEIRVQQQYPVQSHHKPLSSVDSGSSSVRDARATFLLDDSVDGGEESALEMERVRRDIERRQRMFGGRRS